MKRILSLLLSLLMILSLTLSMTACFDELGGDSTGENGGETGENGGETGENGGETGENGGETGESGGDTGNNGGDTGNNGGDTGENGGKSGGEPEETLPPTITQNPTEIKYELSEDGTYYIVTGVRYLGPKLVIPEEHEGKPVKEIAENAFESNLLREIVLPDSITTIRDGAFDDCYAIARATLGKNLTTVEGYSLFYCPLAEVYNRSAFTAEEIRNTLHLEVRNIYSDTEGASKVSYTDDFLVYTDGNEKTVYGYLGIKTNLAIPEGTTAIADQAFMDYRGRIYTVTMPDTVTSIGRYAFAWCTGLRSIRLSAVLTEIQCYTFQQCQKLTGIELPAGLKNIRDHAFTLSGLKRVVIPDGVKSIEQSAFESCPLESVTLGSNTTSIGTEAFRGTNLKSITLPVTLKSIRGKAFQGCNELTAVIFEDASGWIVSEQTVDPAVLSDPAKAAEALTQTYVQNHWQKETV